MPEKLWSVPSDDTAEMTCRAGGGGGPGLVRCQQRAQPRNWPPPKQARIRAALAALPGTHQRCARGLGKRAKQVGAHAGNVAHVVAHVVCACRAAAASAQWRWHARTRARQATSCTRTTQPPAPRSCCPPAMTAGLRGSSSGMSFSTLPTRSAPTSAACAGQQRARARGRMGARAAPAKGLPCRTCALAGLWSGRLAGRATHLGVNAATHTAEQGNGGAAQAVAGDGLEQAGPVVAVELRSGQGAGGGGSSGSC